MMKKCFVLLILFILPLPLCAQQRMTREQYIAKYKDMAIRQMEESGIPASITLAQGCLESGDGNSTLAREANNHFGIKCHDWDGESVYQDDDKKNECFRKYDSAEDSFRDHSDFLLSRSRYAALFSLEPTDYKGWAYGLKAAGYATAKDYAQRLIEIIEENGLSQYDIVENAGETELAVSQAEPDESAGHEPQNKVSDYKVYLQRQFHRQNGVKYIVANGYDTFRSLAKDYRLFKTELMRFNDVRRDRAIPAGEIIYLEPKKDEYQDADGTHISEEGETMYDLSQKYAIRLKSLYKLNGMDSKQEIEAGMTIRLRKNEGR